MHTIGEILVHTPVRAREIANSRSTLSTLIGSNISLLPDEPINGSAILQQPKTMIPRWRRVALAFQRMNYGLMELKYAPEERDDPNFRHDPNAQCIGYDSTAKKIATAKSTLKLGAFELQKRFMSMPTLAILHPIFRY